MSETTPRFALPLLASGQSQKEVTHNEALILADALLAAVVQAVAPPSVPSVSQPGQAWIVGPSPTGLWTGQAGKLAIWTAGGWRFATAPEGMTIWSIADGLPVRRLQSGWQIGHVDASQLRIGGSQVVGARLSGIANPAGGSTIDSEARTAIDSILARLRAHGLIST
jgi:Protein of unknown function (DUF2793)